MSEQVYTPGPRQAVAEIPQISMAGDNMDLEAGGVKFDGGKPRIDLVPGEFIYGVAAVFTYGAIKYDDWNWAKGMRKGRIMAALGRHWINYMMGEDLDDESGLPHLWHMGCCVAMLTSAEFRGVAVEDRQIAVESLRKLQEAFALMKDPAGTKKNAGGSVVTAEVPWHTPGAVVSLKGGASPFRSDMGEEWIVVRVTGYQALLVPYQEWMDNRDAVSLSKGARTWDNSFKTWEQYGPKIVTWVDSTTLDEIEAT